MLSLKQSRSTIFGAELLGLFTFIFSGAVLYNTFVKKSPEEESGKTWRTVTLCGAIADMKSGLEIRLPFWSIVFNN